MLIGVAVAVVAATRAQTPDPVTIKFATLAPEGTVWTKAIQRADRELREKSGGSLRFKIYPGGVSGDEKETIRKMRLGQLHATGVTGSGLADVVPERPSRGVVTGLNKAFVIDGATRARIVRAYPNVQLEQPVAIAASPDGAWWYVAERQGRVWRVAMHDDAATAELVLDIADRVNAKTGAIGLLAIAIDPPQRGAGLSDPVREAVPGAGRRALELACRIGDMEPVPSRHA